MVSSYLQLLDRRYGDRLDEDAREFIRFAVDGAARMQRLIRDLLDYSRIGTRGLKPEPMSMDSALDEALRNLTAAIGESGGAVSRDPFPPVTGDRAQVVRLLQNLVGNALKFRGEEPPLVHVGCEESPGGVVFLVRDNGIGIEEAYFDRIFRIFQKLHTPDRYAGSGVGLAICKRIVERHGGRIRVESEPGRGCTFRFTLPGIRLTGGTA